VLAHGRLIDGHSLQHFICGRSKGDALCVISAAGRLARHQRLLDIIACGNGMPPPAGARRGAIARAAEIAETGTMTALPVERALRP
jgi:hypothetical protein